MKDVKRYIQDSRNGLITATDGLLPAQWDFKPSPECWSIAEIVEHLVVTNELILGPVCDRLASAPPPPADHDRQTIDELIVTAFPDRAKKFKGPQFLCPTGRWMPAEALGRFNETCDRLAAFVESAPGLREHAVDSPPLKAVSNGAYQFTDGYQLMLAMGAHIERHTRQILEWKADAGFPAGEPARTAVA